MNTRTRSIITKLWKQQSDNQDISSSMHELYIQVQCEHDDVFTKLQVNNHQSSVNNKAGHHYYLITMKTNLTTTIQIQRKIVNIHLLVQPK